MDPADDDFCRWDYYYRDANWSCRWWLLQIRRLLLKCQLTMQMMISADEKITITEIPIDPAEDDFYRDYYWDEKNPCRWWDVRVITKIIALKAQKFWGHRRRTLCARSGDKQSKQIVTSLAPAEDTFVGIITWWSYDKIAHIEMKIIPADDEKTTEMIIIHADDDACIWLLLRCK